MSSPALQAAVRDLVTANRILGATKDLKLTVIASIALMLNARMQLEASVLTMASGRPIKYLSDGEAAKLIDTMMMPRGLHRAWEYWAARAGRTTDINIVKR